MKRYVIIVADTNDGDYVTEQSECSETFELKFGDLIKAIKNNQGSWKTREMADNSLEEQYPGIDSKLLNDFDQFVPCGEYGVHTIESIDVLVVMDEIKLL